MSPTETQLHSSLKRCYLSQRTISPHFLSTESESSAVSYSESAGNVVRNHLGLSMIRDFDSSTDYGVGLIPVILV